MKYVCTVCGWEYDESVGYPKGHITLVGCPKLDGVGKDSFEEA